MNISLWKAYLKYINIYTLSVMDPGPVFVNPAVEKDTWGDTS